MDKPEQVPPVEVRDAVFACTGISAIIPESFDHLEKDLLYMRATYTSLPEYMQQYPIYPEVKLKKLWVLVRKIRGE